MEQVKYSTEKRKWKHLSEKDRYKIETTTHAKYSATNQQTKSQLNITGNLWWVIKLAIYNGEPQDTRQTHERNKTVTNGMVNV